MNDKLIFMRGATSDYSYAIRLPPPQADTLVHHEIANVSLASSVPLPPAPCECASVLSPATAVEPTFDRSLFLCVETFPGVSLGPEVEAVLCDTRASRGCDASVAWCISPEIIPVEMAEPLARVWDDSESAKNAFTVLVPGRNPFHLGNRPRSMDINVFHDRTGHVSEPILGESARQQDITLTGRMKPCNSCLPARGQRAPVAERSGGRVEHDLPPNDVLASTCAARSPHR